MADYGTIAEVKAYTRHLLDGSLDFGSNTRPTSTEVERFLTRASGYLNLAIRQAGLTAPISNSTGKVVLDDWAVLKAAEYVEMTQRGTGYSDAEGSRLAAFRGLAKDAIDLINQYRQAFIDLGIVVNQPSGDAIFTGMDAVDQRTDPSDSSMAQPIFRRGLHQYPGTGLTTRDE